MNDNSFKRADLFGCVSLFSATNKSRHSAKQKRETLHRREDGYKRMIQQIVWGYGKTAGILAGLNCRKYMLVCDEAFAFLPFQDYFDTLAPLHVQFSGFRANPLYEDVCNGVQLFLESNCDAIVAVGGGSSIDVAKCIKLFSAMNPTENYLEQPYADSDVPLIAIPTTAGTGSESTRYAVIYFEGQKQSISHDSIVPNFAVLEPSVLETLPLYQKKSTLLDALCQAIESWWSVNAVESSKLLAKSSIELIMDNKDAYLQGYSENVAKKILEAANLAGQAINSTQTTAAHAMSYKLTSLYGVSHGHAAALCLPKVWRYMSDNLHQCIDKRGSDYLNHTFLSIAAALNCTNTAAAIDAIEALLKDWDMKQPAAESDADYRLLANSVNTVRLKNNPVALQPEVLLDLYHEIVR